MVALREDSDFYCVIWLGIAVLAAYYFSFGYGLLTGQYTLTAFLDSTLAPVLGLPPVILFFLYGYLRPPRGRIKTTMLSLAVVASLFFVILCYSLPSQIGGGLGLAVWGIMGALLTTGGFATIHPLDESVTPGLLDVSKLHYGKKEAEDSTPEAS